MNLTATVAERHTRSHWYIHNFILDPALAPSLAVLCVTFSLQPATLPSPMTTERPLRPSLASRPYDTRSWKLTSSNLGLSPGKIGDRTAVSDIAELLNVMRRYKTRKDITPLHPVSPAHKTLLIQRRSPTSDMTDSQPAPIIKPPGISFDEEKPGWEGSVRRPQRWKMTSPGSQIH